MYEFVDRTVAGLDQGSRLLVWSMRSWVRSLAARHCPGHVLAPAFAGRSILAGLQPFMQMMAMFNRHGLEALRFGVPGCDHVLEDEALILSMLCNIRCRSARLVGDTIALLVEDDAVAGTLDAMIRLAAALGTGGMAPQILPLRTRQSPGADNPGGSSFSGG